MQLVAYGAQDVYLTGNPQITFFKVVYRRHTNFSLESIEQTFNGTADFGKKVQCTISRNGDLIHRTYLQVTLPTLTATGGTVAWCSNVGHTLLQSATLQIGGQDIDKHYGDWLNIWADLTLEDGKKTGYNIMTGNNATLTTQGATVAGQSLYIPLQFWFCRNPGLSLPLIALQYHEVKINLEFAPISQLLVQVPTTSGGTVTVSGGSMGYASLYVDYVYLDTDERRRFAQVSHEYLIEQLQFTGGESVTGSSNKIRLNFNHPVKELVWVVQPDANAAANQWDNYTVSVNGVVTNPVVDAKVQLNGHDRFSTRLGPYFNLVQPYQHHTRIPTSRGVNVYSFAMNPEQHQPSGSCNFSRIDNATLQLTLQSGMGTGQVRIYAPNYNILRIMSGMGGLAYSN